MIKGEYKHTEEARRRMSLYKKGKSHSGNPDNSKTDTYAGRIRFNYIK